ncbi:MAG TPA: dipeptidase [Acidimicrobiia bacterium]|nr:dipeptidase [Acidimicrobiia bacterium]
MTAPASSHRAAAERIHADLPVVDGHNDLPWEIRVRAGGSLDRADPRQRLEGYHTDYPRLLAGGVGGQFWSVFVPAWADGPLAYTHRQIDLVEEMAALAPSLTAMARTANEARTIRASGRVAGLLGAEGGHSIENSLDALSGLHERGVRYLTLTHADTIDWADSATDDPRHGGLTEFGRDVIADMNRLGMLVDVSHVSADAMRQAIEASRAPVIASHSSAFALAPHPRNVPDDVVEMIAAGGGVVMVTFVPAFIVPGTARIALDMFEERRQLRAQFAPDDEEGYSSAARHRFGSQEMDLGTVADVVDHIEHVARVGGVDHVGLGGDFDGVEATPAGLEDVSCYPGITEELLRRGWGEPEIRKVLGDNVLRALEVAEEIAG